MSEPGVAQRFFGGLLMAIGGLIVLTSGLCSTVVLANLAIGALSGAFFSGDFASQVNALVGLVLLVGVSGGVPIAVGGGLIWWGRSLQKGRQPD